MARKKRISELHRSRPRRELPVAKPKPAKPKSGKQKLKGGLKRAGGFVYDAAETFANPAAPLWNRLVGPESKWNTKI